MYQLSNIIELGNLLLQMIMTFVDRSTLCLDIPVWLRFNELIERDERTNRNTQISSLKRWISWYFDSGTSSM